MSTLFPQFPPPPANENLWDAVRRVGRMLVNAGDLFITRGARTADLAAHASLHGWHSDDATALELELGNIERGLETLLTDVRRARTRVRDIDDLGFPTLAAAEHAMHAYGRFSMHQASAYTRLTGQKKVTPNQ